ncbi:MAG: hypothetical protein EBX41_10705, partial [Chitinophagia bacterium]|nr:hypothetical protein [Chitinophagia bacterium]
MADVTISSLPLGTPSSNGLIPFSQNNTTSRVLLSSLYDNTILTKPIQPAFAIKANDHNITNPASGYAKINLPNVIFNQGNHWNTSTQRFVAPVNGVYSFSGMLRLNTLPANWVYPMLSVNNISYFELTGGALPGLTNIPTTWSAVAANWHQLVKLNVNDYVELRVGMSSSGTYAVDGQTIF